MAESSLKEYSWLHGFASRRQQCKVQESYTYQSCSSLLWLDQMWLMWHPRKYLLLIHIYVAELKHLQEGFCTADMSSGKCLIQASLCFICTRGAFLWTPAQAVTKWAQLAELPGWLDHVLCCIFKRTAQCINMHDKKHERHPHHTSAHTPQEQ